MTVKRRISTAVAAAIAVVALAVAPGAASAATPDTTTPNTWSATNTYTQPGTAINLTQQSGQDPPALTFTGTGEDAINAPFIQENKNNGALRISNGGTDNNLEFYTGQSFANPPAVNLTPVGATFGVPALVNDTYVQYTERPLGAPAAPAAGGVRLFAGTNASGQTTLKALFSSGAPVVLATHP